MARLRLFGPVREAAGLTADDVAGLTVADVIASARLRYGAEFTAVACRCRVWVNGEPAGDETVVAEGDEVALLPPVSGG